MRCDYTRPLALAIVLLASVVALRATTPTVPLVEAAKNGDHAAVRTLLEQHADVDAAAPDGTTSLHWAASRGDLQTVDLLLHAGAKARAANRYGVQPISLAAISGNGAVVEKLIAAGADANTTMTGGETVLMTAAKTGKTDAIKILLAHGANVNAGESSRGQTALMWAASEGNVAAIQMLVEAGADIHARSHEKDFRFYRQLSGKDAIGGVQTGVTVEFSPLLFAVRSGKLDAVKALLDLGASPNETTPDGTSALVVATINARWDVGAYLLERGADPNGMKQGWTALHQVARTRTLNVGIIPYPVANGRLSSLDFALKLIERGIDVNARMTKEILNDGYRFTMSRLGATAYLVASKGADAQMMRLLATHGANTLTPNNDGTTPLMAAAGVDLAFLGEDTGTHDEAFAAIQAALEFPHDVNAVNSRGDTALHGAARRGALPVVEILIKNGAKLDAKNRQGFTPLTVALGRKNGRPLYLNEQRQLDAAVVIFRAMEAQHVSIDEDRDALDLARGLMPEKGLSAGGERPAGPRPPRQAADGAADDNQ